MTYPEPTMPRSTRHLEERAAAARDVERPISAERAAAITRSIRHIANHVRALRATGSK